MKVTSYIVALALITGSAGAWAQNTLTGQQTDNILIPDYVAGNGLSGISETINLGSSIQSITGVQLTLDIGATAAGQQPFDGDYYAYLTHGSDIAVLLNRVGLGVTGSTSFGSPDTGFDVTFSDGAPDIHTYQSGSYTLNTDGQLTGTWGPDGRNVSPLSLPSIFDNTARTALLSSFDGQNAGGDWTLFIVDCSPGGLGNLEGWSLQVTGAGTQGVPDSGGSIGLLAVGAGLLLLISRRRRATA